MEILTIAMVALLVVAGGMAAITLSLKNTPAPVTSPPPRSADRREQEERILLSLKLQATKDGKPYTDCAVSANGTDWFVPGTKGEALLSVFPFHEYILRAAEGNREVISIITEENRENDKGHILNLDLAPIAPELMELNLADIGSSCQLPFEQTDEFVWTHPSEGVSIKKEGNAWVLVPNEGFPFPAKLLLMGKCTNAHGTADVSILLSSAQTKEPVLIHTPQELSNIRHNLDGSYALAADIDLSNMLSWTPIGDERFPFTGSLDGRGHSILGLKAQQYATGCVGLFGKTENAHIHRILLKEPHILGNYSAYGGTGCLIGWQVGGLTEY
jgi:hypothetical protein